MRGEVQLRGHSPHHGVEGRVVCVHGLSAIVTPINQTLLRQP